MYEYEKMISLVVIMQNLSDLLTWLNELSNAPTYTHTTQKCSCPFSHHFERFFSCLQFRILKNQLFCIGHNRLAQHHGGDSSNDTFHAFCVVQQLAAALLQHLKKKCVYYANKVQWISDHSNSPLFSFRHFTILSNSHFCCCDKIFLKFLLVANLLMEGHSVANENQIFAMLDFNPSISHLEQQGFKKLFKLLKRQ